MRASTGQPESTAQIEVRNGKFSRDLSLRTNDVYLLVLSPSEGMHALHEKASR